MAQLRQRENFIEVKWKNESGEQFRNKYPLYDRDTAEQIKHFFDTVYPKRKGHRPSTPRTKLHYVDNRGQMNIKFKIRPRVGYFVVSLRSQIKVNSKTFVKEHMIDKYGLKGTLIQLIAFIEEVGGMSRSVDELYPIYLNRYLELQREYGC